MKWYNYIFCFFAGIFLTNWVPHFIHGIDGDKFPTPFANPPGTGLSSPVVNILWALANIIIGYLFLRGGKVSMKNKWTVLLFFLGFALLSLMFAIMAPTILVHYKAMK